MAGSSFSDSLEEKGLLLLTGGRIMIENNRIKELLEHAVWNHKIAGAGVIVRKNGVLVCDAQYGYADMENAIPMKKNTILRLASMTKPVIAAGIMRLEEEGKLSIEDEVEKYLPQFHNMKAANKLIGFTEFYEADPDNPAVPRINRELIEDIEETEVKRPATIRDLLTHSSGMGQGAVSMSRFEQCIKPGQTLEERIDIIADTILDFQPGEFTGYSASIAYEVLGRLIEIVSGTNLDTFVKEKICKPMGIVDLGYELSKEQKSRVARLYEAQEECMKDVSETEEFWMQVTPLETGYYSGSAGLMGSMKAYDKFVQMLANKGRVDGRQFLKEETVYKMRSQAAEKRLEMCPGTVWGMGMTVTEEPHKAGRRVGKGTYGWSGAYGTHFYIDIENSVSVVLGVNCSNIGGADSELSRKLEEVVFQEFGGGRE